MPVSAALHHLIAVLLSFYLYIFCILNSSELNSNYFQSVNSVAAKIVSVSRTERISRQLLICENLHLLNEQLRLFKADLE